VADLGVFPWLGRLASSFIDKKEKIYKKSEILFTKGYPSDKMKVIVQ
jgi:hypothetical protein